MSVFGHLGSLGVLSIAQLGFTIWMAVDALRRPAEGFWIWLIVLFQPIGPWIYFFVVKAGDFSKIDFSRIKGLSLFQHRPSLEELRYRAKQTPTLINHLTFAQALMQH